VSVLLLLLPVVVMVVRGGHGDRGFHGGCDYRGEVTLEVVVLANALIVVVLTIMWIFIGIYMAHHLRLSIRLLVKVIPHLHLDHLLARAHISRMI
jgi:hypothetical protein